MRIHYRDGSMREGVIVTLRGTVMRVAVQGSDDALEFRLWNGSWMSENGESVSFAFPLGRSGHETFRDAARTVLRERSGHTLADPWSSCKSVN